MENKLTDELLEQLATLSKLELNDSDKTELREELAQMLAYVDTLNGLRTDDTPPLTHFPECVCPLDTDRSASSGCAPCPLAAESFEVSGSAPSVLRLREDIPDSQPHPEELVALAPRRDTSYYIVPNTLHND